MTKTVRFILDNGHTYHSWNDFKLVRSSKTIGSAEVKKEMINVAGADGSLDLTDFFGEPRFSNRTITLEFTTIKSEIEWLDVYSQIQNAINGRKVKLILDEEPDYYYIGRCQVNDWLSEEGIGKVVVELDCQPWKYKQYITEYSINVSTAETLTCRNMRKSVVPEITTDAELRMTFNNITHVMNAGTHRFTDFVFKEGDNVVSLYGNCHVTITYQEGGL